MSHREGMLAAHESSGAVVRVGDWFFNSARNGGRRREQKPLRGSREHPCLLHHSLDEAGTGFSQSQVQLVHQ